MELQKLYRDRAELALEIENITRKQGEEVSRADAVKKGLVAQYEAIQSILHGSNKKAFDLQQEMLTGEHSNGSQERDDEREKIKELLEQLHKDGRIAINSTEGYQHG